MITSWDISMALHVPLFFDTVLITIQVLLFVVFQVDQLFYILQTVVVEILKSSRSYRVGEQ